MKKKYRSLFVASPGNVLVMCDLSQAESWIVAYMSEDIGMKAALNKGLIHETTASRLYSKPIEAITKTERYAGKQCNHAFAYRMEPKRHMETVNKYSTEPPYITINLQQSTQRFNVWHSTYSNVRNKWWPEIDYAVINTRTLVTPYGFTRHFYGGLREGYERTETLKSATAFIPQSTVADHAFGAEQSQNRIAGGIKEIYRKVSCVGLGNIINTSHDSVCVEGRFSDRQEISEIMIKCMKRPLIIKGEEFTIPVDCEVGDNYGEMKKMKKETV
jgi:hypothetical protein